MLFWGKASGELALGQEFRLLNAGTTGIVGKMLGQGGQGSVYACDVGGRALALKWYKPDVAARDTTLRERLDRLVAAGPPDKRFLFPMDIAEIEGRAEFGYVMQLISPDRQPFDKVMLKPEPSLETRATACYELADCFQQLHAAGLSYQDLNFGSFFVDPVRGGVLICDPDNITADGNRTLMLGMPRFMAPEIERREAMPSSRTDLHSMAVLFFYALFLVHPLEGRRAQELIGQDADGRLRIYGTEPAFIFDPDSDANGPIKGAHDWVVARWKAMPQRIRELFVRAFTRGLLNPDERVVEPEWRAAMACLRDAVARCPSCTFEVPLEAAPPTEPLPVCPACGQAIPRPLRMTLGHYLVSMMPTRQLYAHHVDAAALVTLKDTVAQVDRHPTDETILGLRNLSPAPWQGRTSEGGAVTVVPGRTVRILDGLDIDFGRRQGTVQGADPTAPKPERVGA